MESVDPERPDLIDSAPVLLPKLQIPRLHPSLASRRRLLDRLDAGFERKLTLISAAAGFGKTTLVCQWIAGRYALERRIPVAWLSLDAGDNDPVRFWRYLIRACQALDRNIGMSSLPILASGLQSWHAHMMQPSIEALLTSFLNEINQIPDKSILVLEDYHLITAQAIHEAMANFIAHLPPTLHMILITRSDPPLPLARMRVHGDLVEVNAAQLSFSHEEVLEFLQQTSRFSVTEETVINLEARTEGWAAGMRILTLALRRHDSQQEVEKFLATFAGSHRHLKEYFVSEVLDSQPESIQDFLLRTSTLSPLTGPLCDAITGGNDSGRLLKELERAGLFLLPLDDTGEWYRYHALFAEALQHEAPFRLGTDVMCGCYLRASAWYERNGMIPEAIESSLSAGEHVRAAGLIEILAASPSRHERNELFNLQRWLEQLPDTVLQNFPALCFLYANALVFLFKSDQLPRERLDLVEKVLRMAEEGWQGAENLPGLGEIFAFWALLAFRQGKTSEAAGLARQSLGWLPVLAEYAISRVICLTILGEEDRGKGDFEAAEQKYLEALQMVEADPDPAGRRVVTLLLGELCLTKGELHRAVEYFRQVLSIADDDIADREKALLGLSQVAYEWNELERAEREAREVLQITAQFPDEIVRVRASLVIAQVLQARRKFQEAHSLLQDLLTKVEPSRQPLLHREVIASQADLQLSLGDVAAASRWVTKPKRGDDPIPLLLQAEEGLLTARAWMVLGEAQKSLQTLDEWLEIAQRLDHTRVILDVLLLISLNHNSSGQAHKAKDVIRAALPIAYREGYQRLFIDYGQPALSVLRSVIADVHEKHLFDYLHSLLQAFPPEPEPFIAVASEISVVEPLSSQELRVLRLLQVGLSRREIARELVLSHNTVKTHLRHIYQKLNVTSGSDAIEAARKLRLL